MINYVICMDYSYGFTKDLIYKVIKECDYEITIIDDNHNERWIQKEDKNFKNFDILY